MSHGMKHGSESFFIEGEGLLTTQLGRSQRRRARPGHGVGQPEARQAPGAGRRHRATVPLLPGGAPGTPPERHHHQEAGPRDGRGWGRRRDDPCRLHLPRPVRRPRPHHGPDPGRARPGRVAHDDAPEPLTAARPRLALRQRPRQPRVREVLRGRRHAPADGYDGPGRGREGQAAPRPSPRRQGRREGGAAGADPRPAQRREPDRRADPQRDDLLPQQGGRQDLEDPVPGAALRHRPQAGDPALPVAAAPRLPAADPGADHPQRRVHERSQARRAGRQADRRTDHADRVLGRRVPPGAQHDPRGVQLELPLPRHRRVPGLDVHLLRPGR